MEKESKDLVLDEQSKKENYKIGLAVNYDGNDLNSVYINNLTERFSSHFDTVFIVSEDDTDNIKSYLNMKFITSLKPINNGVDWMLVLESGEYPSIQLINNIQNILSEIDREIKIIKFPIVICDYKTGEIIDLIKPVARLYKQNVQLSKNSINKEIEIKEYPLVKMYVDFTQI